MLDVVFSRCPVGNGTELAIKKGWLQEELVKHDARFCLLQSMDSKFHKSHFTQEYPLHFREGGNIPPIWARSFDDRCVLIGLSRQNDLRGIFVKKDSAIQTIDDLRGKTIAVPRRVDAPIDFRYLTALHGIDTILNFFGMHLSDINLINVPCENIVSKQVTGFDIYKKDDDYITGEFEAVLSGTADAAFSRCVKAARLNEDDSFRNLVSPEVSFRIPNINNDTVHAITCTKPFAYEHPEVVIAYLKVLIATGRYISANQDDFVNSSASGIYSATPEEMKAAFDKNYLYNRIPSFSDEALSQLQLQKEFLYNHGILQNDFSIASWMDQSFLKQAEIEATQIVY